MLQARMAVRYGTVPWYVVRTFYQCGKVRVRYTYVFANFKSKIRYASKIKLRYVTLLRYGFISTYVVCKFWTYRNVLPPLASRLN